jgi:hypothetical protein
VDEDLRDVKKKLIAERKVTELVVAQRDRARYDLELFAAEYRALRNLIAKMPKWVRKMYKLDQQYR